MALFNELITANVISVLIVGLLLGIEHAFEVDHVTAVINLNEENKSIKETSLLGIFWGFGHTVSLLINDRNTNDLTSLYKLNKLSPFRKFI